MTELHVANAPTAERHENEEEEAPVMYEELAALEKEFDDVDVEILRKQTLLQTPLYAKRTLLTSRIPHFWPLVLEQAPPDIDTYVQPSDSEVLNTALRDIFVERFEVVAAPAVGVDFANANADGGRSGGMGMGTGGGGGDPRSLLIRFEFGPNEWFEDDVLEKRFWYRRGRNGWAGLVSEPVRIAWKEGMDMTEGLGDAAVRLWEAEKRVLRTEPKADVMGKGEGKDTGRESLREYKELVEKLRSSTPGSLSFFAWFAFRGRDVSAEESELATREERERREKHKNNGTTSRVPMEHITEEEEEELDLDLDDEDEDDAADEYEVFPLGDELAISIAEDLYPGAIKYFTQAQEQDVLSEADFEDSSADDHDEHADEDGDGNGDGDGDGDAAIPNIRNLVPPRGARHLPGLEKWDEENLDQDEEKGRRSPRPRKRQRT